VAGTAWQGLVVVAGGTTAAGGTSSRVDAFDPKTGQWSRGPNLPVPLRDAALAVQGDDLWIVGGASIENGQPVVQSAAYYFRPGAETWHDGPSLNTARVGAAMATLGNFLVVIGGESSDGEVLDSVEVLTKGAQDWKSPESLSIPRAYATALQINGRVYAIGGKTDSTTAASSVESWRPGGGGWRTESRMDRDRVRGAGAGVCTAGGQNDEGVVTTIECFGTGFWVTHAQMRVPRYGLAAVVIDGWLHLVGGATAGTTVVNTHEVVDLANIAA
jgi:N-acetylneuraminic acid mutarotase